jgi:hypothetical protein
MTKNQLNSMRIIELKMKAQPLTWFEAISRVNRYNYRSVIAMLINRRFGKVKQLINLVRRK